ncbi:MAG: phBC6A51 family helix-turn-helix protein [Patescibacteria group bacterium]
MADDAPAQAQRLGDEETRAATTAERTAREKATLIEQLRRTPIVHAACEKTGVSRQTFYRWRKADEAFAKAADEALSDGIALMNDMAEGQLLSGVRDGNLGAITYWLKHRHAAYGNKIDITAKLRHTTEHLTPEQEAAIAQALKLASLAQGDPSIFFPPDSNGNIEQLE